MKYLIKFFYARFVHEIYIPPHSTFSIGIKSDVIPGAKYWNTYLPEVMTVNIKTNKKGWQQHIFER